MRIVGMAALADAALLGVGLSMGVPAWLLLAAHAALWLFVLRGTLTPQSGASPAVLPALLGLSAGPAGVLAAVMLVAILRRARRQCAPVDWAELLRGRSEATDRRIVDRVHDDRVRHPARDALASHFDMLRYGDVAMRQRVVATVVRSFEPSLAPVIARALIDPDQSIRTQAAAAATEFENGFAARRAELESRAAQHDAAARTDLAILLAEQSENVLFSDRVRSGLRREAMARLEELRARDPSRLHLLDRLARLLLAEGRPQEAARLLEERHARGAPDETTLLRQLDALLRSGDHAGLRRVCEQALAAGVAGHLTFGPKLARMIEFWGRPATAR